METAVSNSTPASPVAGSRWRFSLRTLLVVVLAAAVVSAGLGWRWRRAQRQAAIVDALRSAGVNVMYDYQVQTSDEGSWGRFTIVPGWLRNLLGEDFFSDVHSLSLGGSRSGAPPDGWKSPLGPRVVSAERCRQAFAIAAPLGQIRWLSIHDAVVRKDALDQLRCWERLTDIRIDGCDVRDEDLAPLARASNVIQLQLNRQPIGDEAVGHLRNMRKLRTLGLGVTNVTDKGLAELAHFPELRELWMFHVDGVTDHGMVHIGRCRQIRFLELSKTSVGDEGLKELAHLRELHYLNLCKTSVTDAGLKHLAPLPNLEEGIFFGTSVTQAGIDQVPSLVRSGNYAVGKPANPVASSAQGATSP